MKQGIFEIIENTALTDHFPHGANQYSYNPHSGTQNHQRSQFRNVSAQQRPHHRSRQ